jgi:hypothetical protein
LRGGSGEAGGVNIQVKSVVNRRGSEEWMGKANRDRKRTRQTFDQLRCSCLSQRYFRPYRPLLLETRAQHSRHQRCISPSERAVWAKNNNL